MTDKQTAFLALVTEAFEAQTARLLVFSKSTVHGVEKLRILPRTAGDKLLYVTERTLADGRVTQKNSPAFPLHNAEEALDSFLSADLCLANATASYKRNKKGSEVVLCPAAVHRAIAGGEKAAVGTLQHEKERMLTGSEPFLFPLGIADKNGNVLPTRQPKYRQICRFLEFVRDILPSLPPDGLIRVYDLCCGKCYLSFAVYHYLKNILGREVDMLCVDLKEDVIRDCKKTAEELGFDGMRFICGDIRKLDDAMRPDLVLSLHACDVATDIVLETAVRLGAAAILSTPCCHRALSKSIHCEPLDFALRFGVLSDKLCTVLTDALRTLYLEKSGYTVTAAELIDPDNTPKNVILRATRGIRPSRQKDAEAEYRAARRYLGLPEEE